MELPRRARGDELLRPGELADIRKRLRKLAQRHDLATVIACAFDHRTRLLPFIYADVRIAPAGVRAVGSAMADAGFEKTRIVLQQWNRNFRPSRMRLDGRVPDLFMVSSMQMHSEPCQAMIRDACRIDPAHRPLILAGGPKVIYEPWDVFSADPADPWGADVAVTGEEYVLLSLLEVLLSVRAGNEPMRAAFARARDGGALDEVPGLVYARGERDGLAEELVDTGIQRLVGDLDELPHPVLGFRLLEPPGRGEALAPQALPAGRVRRHSPLASLVMTFGCKFACSYCPIPAYNQRQYRVKSGERIADEVRRLHEEYGTRFFFGADDNFFNDPPRTLEIVEAMARTEINGVSLRHIARIGTEATVHDTLRMKDHLRVVRRAGIRALWLGVEDMTGALVRKGQSPDDTAEVFRLLRRHGIVPMPMMMHHDDQSFYTRGSPAGLLNQVRLLRKAGASGVQVLMITPSPGSASLEQNYTSGMVYERVGSKRVRPYMIDGNYVIASRHKKPWRRQLSILAAYMYFYNPLQLLIIACHVRNRLSGADIGMQIFGMYGLTRTIRRTFAWAVRLLFCRIVRCTAAPASRIPMRGAGGGPASHAPPGTPTSRAGLLETKA